MVKRMTSWTLNILIVVTTAFVVILPDPAEIRSAFEYRNNQRPMVIIDTAADDQMVVVAEFESMQALDTWHNSDEYKALVPLREEGSIQHMVAYEARQLPQA